MKIQQNCHCSQPSSIKWQTARKKIRVYYYLRGAIDLTKMFSAAAAGSFYGAAQFINRKVLSGAGRQPPPPHLAHFSVHSSSSSRHQNQSTPSGSITSEMKHRWAAIKKDVGTVNFLQFFFSLVWECSREDKPRRHNIVGAPTIIQ